LIVTLCFGQHLRLLCINSKATIKIH